MTAPVALVTAGSRGIGAATARMLAQRGYDVVISYLSNDAAASAVRTEIEASGRRALCVAGDLAREADILQLFESVDREFGALDALVNNAGITGGFSRVEDVTAEVLTSVSDINYRGTFLCCREAIKRMARSHGGNGGVIVNVSSTAATRGSPGEWVHYAATKGAVNTLTVGLAAEVARDGIRVNAVSPGVTQTELHGEAGDPGRPARLAEIIPMGRPGTPEEAAAAICWLLSDEASYTTGAILPVGGGF